MTRITVICPCSKVVSTTDIPDNGEFKLLEYVGECEVCSKTGDYTKSPNWKKDPKPVLEFKPAGVTPLKPRK